MLKNTDAFIFGYQYYRAPTPFTENWEKDLKKIKEDGFNTVKFWVQWRWSNPEEGVYNWEDIDRLLEIAEAVGLKVVLNFILDVAPVWVIKKYPDSVMITASGEKLHPSSIISRQIGGAPGVCFNHAETSEIRFKFLEVAVQRFKKCNAVYSWDIWNEPELTVSIKREQNRDDLVCYCPNCIIKFRKYLHNKYGDIKKLNRIWGRNYRCFEDVEPPRLDGTYMDMIDWRLFFIHTISEDARIRAEIVRKNDDMHRDVHCHLVLPPIFNSITCASDGFEIVKYCDSIGSSCGYDDFSNSMLLSQAKNKPALNSEVHMTGGTTFLPFTYPSEQKIYSQILRPIFKGIKGFMVWQYRAEILGYESPAWGVVTKSGNNTILYDKLIEINAFISKYEKDFLKISFDPTVAVYTDNRDEIIVYNEFGNVKLFQDTLVGAFSMLNDCNKTVGFINSSSVINGELGKYDVVYFANFYVVSENEANKIISYVLNGGTAVFESFFGIIDPEKGTYSETVPTAGIAEAFGITVSEIKASQEFYNSYYKNQFDDNNIDIYVGQEKYCGSHYNNVLTADGAEILATFADGSPAVIERRVGKGKVIVFNTLFACQYKKQNGKNTVLLNKLLGLCSDDEIKKKEIKVKTDKGTLSCYINDRDEKVSFTVEQGNKILFGAKEATLKENELELTEKSLVVLINENK